MDINHAYFSNIVLQEHHRSRRCVCLKIKPLCHCNNEQHRERVSQEQPEQVDEKSLQAASATEMNSTIQSMSTTSTPSSACIPKCLQGCIQNHYSRCQQSCRNTCEVEQLISATESLQTVQEQQQVLQWMQEYPSIQYQPRESNIEKHIFLSKSKVRPSTSISTLESNVMIEENKPPSSVFSDSTGQLKVPYRSSDDSDICVQACMSSCHRQCVKPTTSVPIPAQFHQPLESSVHQATPPENSLHQESVAHKISQRIQTPCASLCMPSCQEHCIHQVTILSGAFYSTSPPALTYMDSVEAQPAEDEVQESGQHSMKAKGVPMDVLQKAEQSLDCHYPCQDSCVQQCIKQNKSAVQCRISCSYPCCINQQQQLFVTRGHELPVVEEQPQQISRKQYPSSFTQVQQIPIQEVAREQVMPHSASPLQQHLQCLQQLFSKAECIRRIIASANLEAATTITEGKRRTDV
uniref:CRC domain-containing protein n=1 Tax=Setaria digitata TaxID=48799 RepID=A0A915PTM6_9BILA